MDRPSACRVSVLCAAFNHEEYLRQTLDSFVGQKTDFPFEVLINDDASTDGTAAVIREYAGRYPEIIRPFYQAENLYSRRINVYDTVFFPAARGEFIALCEGDDFWCDETKLQRQVDWLDAHPEYSACVHNSFGRFIDGSKPDQVLFAQDGDRDIPFETVIRGMGTAYHTSSILARREFILDPPDYRNIAYNQGYFTDYAVGVRLCLEGKVRFLDRCMSVYRIGSNPTAWSHGISQEYGKLKRFVSGEIAMLNAVKAHVSPEQLPVVEQVILEREYELLYIEGRVDEMVKPPYDRIHRGMGRGRILSTDLKRAFPHLHRLYRKRRGYGD